MAEWKDVYPRPQLRREKWQSLDGEWLAGGAFAEGSGFMTVPSCRTEEEVFYSTSFDFERTDDVVLLHFEAADQIADVRLNGLDLGIHSGGYLPFEFDVSDIVVDGVNSLEVRVVDRLSHDYPYGKQRKDRGGMWYTPMSGLWQSVWIEQVPRDYIRSVRVSPGLDGADAGRQGRGMQEDLLPVVGGQESEAFVGVEPLHFSGRHVRSTSFWSVVRRAGGMMIGL